MPALCALTAPSVISYLRLTPHRWSAGYNSYGFRNREAGVRICPVDDTPGNDISKQVHLEFRASDATASPYMVLGALVRAGIEGLRAATKTPPLVEGDPADLTAEELQKLDADLAGKRTALDQATASLTKTSEDAKAKETAVASAGEKWTALQAQLTAGEAPAPVGRNRDVPDGAEAGVPRRSDGPVRRVEDHHRARR